MRIMINTAIFRWAENNEETFLGMEYIQDQERVPVYIKYKFRAPVIYQNINFDDGDLHVRQLKNGEILCTLEKKISKKLFTDVCNFFTNPKNVEKTNNFILGYVYRTLGSINDRILKEKYERRLFLVKPISIFDIYEIAVLDKTGVGGMAIWPTPFNIDIKNISEEIHIRDYIDAVTSYLTFNYDDCIRKIITSLENFLKTEYKKRHIGFIKKLLGAHNEQSFGTLIKNQITTESYFLQEKNLEILKSNLNYTYDLRCKIVHDEVRLTSSHRIICLKGLVSAGYILQGKKKEHEAKNLLDLIMMFTSVDQHNLFDLDFIEKYLIKWSRKKIGIIDKNDWKTIYLFTRFFDISCDLFSKQFTDALFDDLKITRSEKRMVKS